MDNDNDNSKISGCEIKIDGSIKNALYLDKIYLENLKGRDYLGCPGVYG
jgi:hypothetical protein